MKSKFVIEYDDTTGHIATTLDLADDSHLPSFIAELGKAQGVFINMAISKATGEEDDN